MIPYFAVLLAYLLAGPALGWLTGNATISLIFKLASVSLLLFIYRRKFRFRVRFDMAAILLGVAIALVWVSIDSLYPHIPGESQAAAFSMADIFLKLLIGVAIAPVAEEFFTRFFLNRWIISKDWENVRLGKFTMLSFALTCAFFGFSHTRWLAGLITGALLNLLLYYRKDIGPCILSHAIANLVLGIYVIATGSFQFW